MKFLKASVAVLVVAASTLVIARILVPRFRCNAAKGRIQVDLDRLRSGRLAMQHAHALLAECRRCLDRYPPDYEYAYFVAAYERIMGRNADAERSLLHAIDLNERAEFYTQLGLLQLARGDVAAARRSVTTAAMFNLVYAEALSYPLGTEIAIEVEQRHERLRSSKQTK